MKANHNSDTLKDIHSIYQLLESRDEGNIGIALGMLKNNEDYLQQAEKRYLKFVQTRLNDPTADLSKFYEASLSLKEEKEILDKIYVKHNSIGFEYMDGAESKMMVDTIGGIVAAYFDVEKYKKHARTLKTKEKLVNWAEKKGLRLQKEMEESLEIYKDGWFGKIQEKLTQVDPRIIRLDHTSFDDANSSLVMEEFLFYLDAYCSWDLMFDIFQSDEPNFPEIFWMLSEPPETYWGDTYPSFPDSPMSFNQIALYREGDEGAMKRHRSHKKRKRKINKK